MLLVKLTFATNVCRMVNRQIKSAFLCMRCVRVVYVRVRDAYVYGQCKLCAPHPPIRAPLPPLGGRGGSSRSFACAACRYGVRAVRVACTCLAVYQPAGRIQEATTPGALGRIEVSLGRRPSNPWGPQCTNSPAAKEDSRPTSRTGGPHPPPCVPGVRCVCSACRAHHSQACVHYHSSPHLPSAPTTFATGRRCGSVAGCSGDCAINSRSRLPLHVSPCCMHTKYQHIPGHPTSTHPAHPACHARHP